MILNNIIIPLKHPYISPEVTFEEMEGESMICLGSGNVTGDDIVEDEEDEDQKGNVKSKESIFEDFVFDQEGNEVW